MKSKKVIVLLISLTLLVSMTLPGTVAVYADQAADSGHRNLMPENEEKDTSLEVAGDPDSSGANQSEGSPEPSGANQNEDPPVPSGADQGGDSSGSSGANQSEDPPEPSGADQGEAPPEPSGADQSGDSSVPSGPDQSADPSQPEEPGNTGEQDTCNCGHEDGPHDKDCPMYEAPEGLEEEEEESNGASLTVHVQVSGEDNRNAVLNLTGPGDYRKRIVVHGSDSVTLSGLGAGEYTVSAGGDSQSVTLQAGVVSSVNITVTRSNHGWLTGEAYQVFNFDS